MKNLKLLSSSIALATILTLSGCGDDSPTGNHSDISFPSNSTKADATVQNGQKVESVVTAKDIKNISGLNEVEEDSAINTTQLALKSADIIKANIKSHDIYALNYTQDMGTESCSGGGTIQTSVSASLTSTNGAYTTVYNQCNDGDTLTNGTVEYSASLTDYANDNLDSLHIYFTTDFSIRDNSSNKTANIKKNSNFTIKTLNDSKIRLDISLQATHGTDYYGQNNATYYLYDAGNNSYIYQTAGRIYINNLDNYVDYDTSYDMSQTPFGYDSNGVLVSGEGHYLMAGNGKLKIKVESADNPVTYIDADGDGVFEQHE